MVKKFNDPQHYLFPLPTTELLLNKNLTQNPDW
ncbi:RagB/SusD family nutrient uptake outer membrane protein [Niabella ginsengisoli]|uniref:RagB/SusD family nutrient uptake outer membrane protein n=1 Tax=Niabella ginsengisoli TaxID=522298 RepID=A0ABS9SLI3_9BACT|nr:RagB/SusD family nutrient uptake outer membrane protein [Niabella ginsengisoli]MCH5599014.1 RagB/SusD family nutrient uptake outer membrane protein [Niabella ginsengisoli]